MHSVAPVKVLVDNGIASSANFLVPAQKLQEVRWGDRVKQLPIAGFARKEITLDAEQQVEMDALFTVGRLARSGRISLFTYGELSAELWRGSPRREPLVNAFGGYRVNQCPPAIERTKFRGTIGFDEWMSKGGKKDRKRGREPSDFGQIPFFDWLASLRAAEIDALIGIAANLRLTKFEVDSLRDLGWFQMLAKARPSQENLPDCFHIWTARRNGISVFLTLEKTLPTAIRQILSRREKTLDIDVAVLRPGGLLQLLGVQERDPVPLQPGRFYTVAEVFAINSRLGRM
jgi:hypothetical protein